MISLPTRLSDSDSGLRSVPPALDVAPTRSRLDDSDRDRRLNLNTRLDDWSCSDLVVALGSVFEPPSCSVNGPVEHERVLVVGGVLGELECRHRQVWVQQDMGRITQSRREEARSNELDGKRDGTEDARECTSSRQRSASRQE